MRDNLIASALISATTRLTRRADFQRASRGLRVWANPFALQFVQRSDPAEGDIARVGFTVTKKIGNSPIRNRIRRRLREAIRLAGNLAAEPDHDYVLMAKREALGRDFSKLIEDVERAFKQARDKKSAKTSARPRSADKDRQR